MLTVTGTGFDSKTPANNLITISDRACVVVSATETVIKCTVGEGAVGQHVVDFTVIGKGAPSYGNGQFKFTYTAVITGISPKKGSIGGECLVETIIFLIHTEQNYQHRDLYRFLHCNPEDAYIYTGNSFFDILHVCVHCSVIVWWPRNRNSSNIWISIIQIECLCGADFLDPEHDLDNFAPCERGKRWSVVPYQYFAWRSLYETLYHIFSVSNNFQFGSFVQILDVCVFMSPFVYSPGATQLTVSGKGFSNKAIVKVGGVECLSYTSKSFSQIVCETPPGVSRFNI